MTRLRRDRTGAFRLPGKAGKRSGGREDFARTTSDRSVVHPTPCVRRWRCDRLATTGSTSISSGPTIRAMAATRNAPTTAASTRHFMRRGLPGSHFHVLADEDGLYEADTTMIIT